MEAFVLLGGFAAVAVFGYFLMSKLDNWLATLQNSENDPDVISEIRIATSQLDSVPSVSAILKELSCQYPELHSTLVLGQEQELTNAFARGSVDLVIVSVHTTISLARRQNIALPTQPVDIADGTVELRMLEQDSTHQQLLWKNGESRPYMLELIHRLCGQQ